MENNWKELHKYFTEIEGQICWNVFCSYGSMITLNFGKKTPNIKFDTTDSFKGDWSLRLEQSQWQIYSLNKLLLDWNETSEHIKIEVPKILNGIKLLKIDHDQMLNETTLFFDKDLLLKTYCYDDAANDKEMDRWVLYTPYRKCFILTSKNNLTTQEISARD